MTCLPKGPTLARKRALLDCDERLTDFAYTMLPLTRFALAATRSRPHLQSSKLFCQSLELRASAASGFSSSAMVQDPFKPAARVSGQRQDVW
jgi:hypothetical protein